MARNYAVVRLPPRSLYKGLSIKNRGSVDVPHAQSQHSRYRNALSWLGYNLIVLLPEENYPDSVFVEDPGIALGDTYVVARLTASERQGEETLLLNALHPYFRSIEHIESPGFVEGGDVIVTHKDIYIGLSGRTNCEGAQQLMRIAYDRLGLEGHTVHLPEDWLHLKGAASFQASVGSKGAMVVCEELANQMHNKNHKLIVTPSQEVERFGANCISRGKKILVHADCQESANLLRNENLDVRIVSLGEYAKIDGAMSCLSKMF